MQPDTMTPTEEQEERSCAFCGANLDDSHRVVHGLCFTCARDHYGE